MRALLHQFQALVSRPSMHDPASKKLSAPEPSKPWRKKSVRIVWADRGGAGVRGAR